MSWRYETWNTPRSLRINIHVLKREFSMDLVLYLYLKLNDLSRGGISLSSFKLMSASWASASWNWAWADCRIAFNPTRQFQTGLAASQPDPTRCHPSITAPAHPTPKTPTTIIIINITINIIRNIIRNFIVMVMIIIVMPVMMMMMIYESLPRWCHRGMERSNGACRPWEWKWVGSWTRPSIDGVGGSGTLRPRPRPGGLIAPPVNDFNCCNFFFLLLLNISFLFLVFCLFFSSSF